MLPASRKAVVIGAGLGGLAIALRLAARGWRVTICEQGTTVGGKMNRWSSNGYSFDTGPSLITMPWIFRELFEAVGARLEDYLELVSMRPIMQAIYPNGTKFIYSNVLPEWLETIRALEPRDVDGFLRFMTLGARIFELSKETFLRRMPTAPPDARSLRALRHFPLRHAWGNYHRSVAAHFRSPYLRQLYDRYPTYVGSSPYSAPATLMVIPYIEHAFGGWYVRGGLYRIIEALISLAEKHAVQIITGCRIETIETAGNRTTAVRTSSGQRIQADLIIMNGDASAASQMLGTKNASALAPAQRSMSGIVMLLGTRKRLPDLHHHSVFFSSNYPREFAQIFDERQFPEEPTVYVSAPSQRDRSLAPPDGESLFVMANAPATGEQDWTLREQEVRDRVFRVLHRGGFPVTDADIAVEQMWTPQSIAQRYEMPGGAIYGTHSHGWRSAFLRPPNKDAHVSGLYYVGGSTHPGGGTPTVLISAQITDELIQQNEVA